MRKPALMFVLGPLLATCLAPQPIPPAAFKPETPAQGRIEEMKAHAERMDPADRARIYADISRELVEVANQQFTDGNTEKGHASIKDAVTYAEKSAESAQEKGKKIKNAEISLRETARRIEEVRRTLAVDDQPQLKEASERIEELRRKLLQHMFGGGNK